MKRPTRDIAIFTLSALDLLAMALGAFVVITVVLMPYYRQNFHDLGRARKMQASVAARQAEAEDLRRAAIAAGASAAELEAEGDRLRRAAAARRKAATALIQQADAANEQAGRAEKRARQREATVRRLIEPAMDLVFVVDSTGSMVKVLEDLGRSMSGIVKVLERLVGTLRVGIVTYRDRDNSPWVVRTLPLTRADGGGLHKILDFASALRPAPRGGGTVTEALFDGLRAAEGMAWRAGAKHGIIVIGDAAAHPNQQRATLALAQRFHQGGPKRDLAVLFIDTLAYRTYGRGDREFFQMLARAGGGRFSAREGDLVEHVLLSVIDD